MINLALFYYKIGKNTVFIVTIKDAHHVTQIRKNRLSVVLLSLTCFLPEVDIITSLFRISVGLKKQRIFEVSPHTSASLLLWF